MKCALKIVSLVLLVAEFILFFNVPFDTLPNHLFVGSFVIICILVPVWCALALVSVVAFLQKWSFKKDEERRDR